MAVILFDLFGTLVSYSASRTEQGYPRSAAVLEAVGCRLAYDEWLGRWAAVGERLDRQAEVTGIEFSMREAFEVFAPEVGLDPDDEEVADQFLGAYLDEWSTGVHPIDGAAAMLGRLAADGHRNVLVSNTHDADMVRGHLLAVDLLPHLTAVVTSVEVGFRKPRPEIFAAALDPLRVEASDAVFVGDTFVADYEGPTSVGIEAYLIVPDGESRPDALPPDRRLRSVLEIEALVGT